MDIDGYTYRKCGACGEHYYIHEGETECRSCRGVAEESADGDSECVESDGERADSADGVDQDEDARQSGDTGTSSAIAMIKRVNRGGGGE